ncbi:MAG TPA: ABC transporter ATP-binding protein [Streptosporangiaceae bacterium]|jgi:iron(III) transport system ATP-binding protein
MPELTVRGLTKRFGGATTGTAGTPVTALDDVSFTVNDGEFFTLLGPSGCGKSTTLAAIAGLEAPDGGRITAGDVVFVDTAEKRFLNPEERNLGMVFQSYALWPHMTVAANLDLPLKLRGLSRADRDKRIDAALEQVGLGQYRRRYPHQMSGGQQQRVALARALVYSPTVLLLDEPLSNLDAKLREQARAWLKELQEDVGITTIYVTHDQTEALTLSDRIAVMRDGKMLQVGTPEEIYERPADPAVADFVGRCNFLLAEVAEGGAAGAEITVRVAATGTPLRVTARQEHAAGDTVTLGIRAERIAVRAPGDGEPGGAGALPARLVRRLYSGSRYEYELDCGGHPMTAEDTAVVEGGTDGAVWLTVPPDGVYTFAGDRTSEVGTGAGAPVAGAAA